MVQDLNELFAESRKADRIDRERIELFEVLVKSPGWAAYLEILNAKLQSYADQILAPSGSIDAMIGLEYVKGAMSGLILARDIPAVTIAAKDQLRTQPGPDEELEDDVESVG